MVILAIVYYRNKYCSKSLKQTAAKQPTLKNSI